MNHTLKNLGISQLSIMLQFALYESIRSPALLRSFGFVDQPVLISFILFSYVIGPVSNRARCTCGCMSSQPNVVLAPKSHHCYAHGGNAVTCSAGGRGENSADFCMKMLCNGNVLVVIADFPHFCCQ